MGENLRVSINSLRSAFSRAVSRKGSEGQESILDTKMEANYYVHHQHQVWQLVQLPLRMPRTVSINSLRSALSRAVSGKGSEGQESIPDTKMEENLRVSINSL